MEADEEIGTRAQAGLVGSGLNLVRSARDSGAEQAGDTCIRAHRNREPAAQMRRIDARGKDIEPSFGSMSRALGRERARHLRVAIGGKRGKECDDEHGANSGTAPECCGYPHRARARQSARV